MFKCFPFSVSMCVLVTVYVTVSIFDKIVIMVDFRSVENGSIYLLMIWAKALRFFESEEMAIKLVFLRFLKICVGSRHPQIWDILWSSFFFLHCYMLNVMDFTKWRRKNYDTDRLWFYSYLQIQKKKNKFEKNLFQ